MNANEKNVMNDASETRVNDPRHHFTHSLVGGIRASSPVSLPGSRGASARVTMSPLRPPRTGFSARTGGNGRGDGHETAGWLRRGIVVLAFLQLSPTWAEIEVPPVTSDRVRHVHNSGEPGTVRDILIYQSLGPRTDSFSADLDRDTVISYRVQAPEGSRFLVEPPASAEVSMQFSFSFGASGAPNTAQDFSVTFENLEGRAPVIPASPSNRISADSIVIAFLGSSEPFSESFSFTAMTLRLSYSPRSLGLGPIDYHPVPNNLFWFIYTGADPDNDPGAFVRIVPSEAPVRPRLSIQSAPDGQVEVTVFGESGRHYLLEAASDLSNWNTIEDFRLEGASHTTRISGSEPRAQFFRAQDLGAAAGF